MLKITISLAKDLYGKIQAVSKKMNISKNKLFQNTVKIYISEYKNRQIIKKLNKRKKITRNYEKISEGNF